jgi:hypothetical protein
MANNKMTAIEWLIKEIDSQYPHMNILWKQWMIEQAKEKEKQEMLEFGSRVAERWGLTSVEPHYIEDEYNKAYAEKTYTEKVYEVWSEGYAATGESAGARFHGKFKGMTFKDAVESYINTLSPDAQKSFNGERLTYWGCRFFDNEQDARKSFG